VIEQEEPYEGGLSRTVEPVPQVQVGNVGMKLPCVTRLATIINFMKQTVTIFALVIFLISCASIGNKVLYQTTNPIVFKKLGYVNSEYDTVTNGLYSNANYLFTSTVNDFIKTNSTATPAYLHTMIAYDNIDSLKLKNICKENGFDVILLTKLYFISRYFVYKGLLNIKPDNQQFLSFTQSDVCVEMKLFDNQGKLLVFISYNTPQGNGITNSPKEGIVKGTKGGMKELFSVINPKK